VGGHAVTSRRVFYESFIFIFFISNTYVVRLIGFHEHSRKPWVACVDSNGALGSVQPHSLAFRPDIILPHLVPSFVSDAVAPLLDSDHTYRIARRPRRVPRHAVPYPDAAQQPLALYTPVSSHCPALLGPLSCHLPPASSLADILDRHPGPPACPAHLAHLRTWGFLDHRLSSHPAACIIFERLLSHVKEYAASLPTPPSPYQCRPPPQWVARHIYGLTGPCPTLSSSAHFVRLLDGSRFSLAAMTEILHGPVFSGSRLSVYFGHLASVGDAQRLLCQGFLSYDAAALYAAVLRIYKGMLRTAAFSSASPVGLVYSWTLVTQVPPLL
jgi:hypothetical protein